MWRRRPRVSGRAVPTAAGTQRIKYIDLVANAVILHTGVDMTAVLLELTAEGQPFQGEDLGDGVPE
ncbi:MAG: hypothetical protein ACRDJN_30955, partial [Chloroflexota bacterium]